MDESIRHKRGDVREDGLIFWQYDRRRGLVFERWYDKAKFDRALHLQSLTNKRRVRDPEKERERCRSKSKKYRRENLEDARKKDREYKRKIRQERGDEIRAANREWCKKNRWRLSAVESRRRALEREAIHPQHDPNDDKKLSHIKDILGARGEYGVDHIVPLTRGGIHIIYNLRILPKSLNSQKRNRLDSELTPQQQQECYFWRILTRFLTCSYDYANAA